MGHFSPLGKRIVTVSQGNIHGNLCVFSCKRKDSQLRNGFWDDTLRNSLNILILSTIENNKTKRITLVPFKVQIRNSKPDDLKFVR